MPLPMVHLAIAVQAHSLAGQALAPAFALGSLAPDAIHMRENTDRDDKDRVHLRIWQASEAEAMERILSLADQHHSAQNDPDPFVEGYAAHLMTDYWWLQTIARPFFEQLPEGTAPEERRKLYYLDTDQVDFNLYHRAPWRQEVWGLLEEANAPDFPPHLSADEVDRWRRRTLDWFEKLKEEPGIMPRFITDEVVAEFINASSQRLRTLLFASAD